MPDDIITQQVLTNVEIEDKDLRLLAEGVFELARVAAEKAVAHHFEPNTFKLPADTNSFEQIFVSRFRELPEPAQQAAKARIMPRVNTGLTVRTKHFPELARVNLREAASVENQLGGLPAIRKHVIQEAQLDNLVRNGRLVTSNSSIPVPPIPSHIVEALKEGLRPQQTTDKLELVIAHVKCWDETGSTWLAEQGKDEMSMAATTVDAVGTTRKVQQFSLGSYDDKDERWLNPPKALPSFDLRQGGSTWPKTYYVTLILAEKDNGGLAKFVSNLWEKIKDKVRDAIVGATGVGGTVIGAAIGAAVAWVLGKIMQWIKAWLSDDIFAPVTLQMRIPSLNARWPGGKTDSGYFAIGPWFGYGGNYSITCVWRMFA